MDNEDPCPSILWKEGHLIARRALEVNSKFCVQVSDGKTRESNTI